MNHPSLNNPFLVIPFSSPSNPFDSTLCLPFGNDSIKSFQLNHGEFIQLIDVSGNTININIDNNGLDASNCVNPYFSGRIWVKVCKRQEMGPIPENNDQSKCEPVQDGKRLFINVNNQCATRCVAVSSNDSKINPPSHRTKISNNKPVPLPSIRGVSSTPSSLSSDSSTYPVLSRSSSLHKVPSIPSNEDPRIEALKLLISQLTVNEKYETINFIVKDVLASSSTDCPSHGETGSTKG